MVVFSARILEGKGIGPLHVPIPMPLFSWLLTKYSIIEVIQCWDWPAQHDHSFQFARTTLPLSLNFLFATRDDLWNIPPGPWLCLKALLQDIQIGQQKVGRKWKSCSAREHLHGFKCDIRLYGKCVMWCTWVMSWTSINKKRNIMCWCSTVFACCPVGRDILGWPWKRICYRKVVGCSQCNTMRVHFG